MQYFSEYFNNLYAFLLAHVVPIFSLFLYVSSFGVNWTG